MYSFLENQENNLNSVENNALKTIKKGKLYEKYVLKMILEAIEEENESRLYFEQLANVVSNEEDKATLRKIYLDDTKHFNMLVELYKFLTGKEPKIEFEDIDIDYPLKDEFLDSIDDKLENIELYRNIMNSFLDTDIRDMLFEIITDEQGHIPRLYKLLKKY